MKWYKHLSGSLNDSFIFELIERHGHSGYVVFFGILEMMSDEFDIHNPGISRFPIKKLAKNLQISVRKLKNIMNYISEKGRITAEFDGKYVTVNCQRLRELCDNWTEKLLRSESRVNTKHLRPIEVEVEVEVEVDKKLRSKEVKNNTTCSEPQKDASSELDDDPSFITITLNDKTEYPITEKVVIEMAELYPAVDVRQAFRAMKGWSNTNPTKRKTKRGIKKFYNGWLSRKQDENQRGKPKGGDHAEEWNDSIDKRAYPIDIE
uniref:Uncharacterized protein n=1 Tax=viral metagenome TaxID=1070528 RepID=A0A6M3LK42_9ZZZZ